MSNNPNWKRQLQDKINEHNRQHGSKPQISTKTGDVASALKSTEVELD